jgi:integration host factor subunit alpha
MSTTKADLVNRVYETNPDLTKAIAKDAVETLLDIIKSNLEQGEDILLSGFGKFSVKHKAARKGRNPQTGEEAVIEARRVVTFKPSGKLRERLNQA